LEPFQNQNTFVIINAATKGNAMIILPWQSNPYQAKKTALVFRGLVLGKMQ